MAAFISFILQTLAPSRDVYRVGYPEKMSAASVRTFYRFRALFTAEIKSDRRQAEIRDFPLLRYRRLNSIISGLTIALGSFNYFVANLRALK